MSSKAKKVISTGIIGYGSSGKRLHTPLLLDNPNFSLYAIATQSSSQSKHLPDGTIQLTPEQLIVEPNIDLVIVATPNDSHYFYAKKALLAGKNVVIEKPIALKAAHIAELIELAQGKGLLLTTFHNRLWDGDFLAIRKIIEQQTLGTVHSYSAQVNRYWPTVIDNWREHPQHGGAVWELAPNLIEQALTLFGHPNSIFADISTLRGDACAPDNFYIRLTYPSLTVELRSNSLIKHSGPRYFIHGDIGSYIKQGVDPQHQQLKDGMSPSDHKYGKEIIDNWGSLYTCNKNKSEETLCPSPNGDYPQFYHKIYLSLTKNQTTPVSNQRALDVVALINAAHISSEQKKVISLEV